VSLNSKNGKSEKKTEESSKKRSFYPCPLFEGKPIIIVLSGEKKQKVTATVFESEINIAKS
jgi:6-phosphogluconolactonase/glucosamine-6-phosphate isomerase/deaminase